MKTRDESPPSQSEVFRRQGAMKPNSMLTEYLFFLRTTKKWWLAPLIGLFLILGAFIVLSSTAVAPFIYTLF